MNPNFLDFEQPIAELEVKIDPFFNDLYCIAAGRVLLSFSEEHELKQYADANGMPGRKWDTISSWSALQKAAAEVRKQGYASDSTSRILEKTAYPVMTGEKLIGALSIRVPKSVFKGENRKKCMDARKNTVKKIEQVL